MAELYATAALLLGVLAVALAVLAWVATRSIGAALPVLLDLLLAAGLIRLASDLGWRQIATAAAIVALRRVLAWALRSRGGAGPRVGSGSTAAARFRPVAPAK